MNTAAIRDYNTDVQRAVHAYRADRAVAEGWCAACQVRRKNGHSRKCWRCIRAARRTA